MRYIRSLVHYLLGLLLCVSVCHATDLLDVYYQALENDPTFKAAYSSFMADSQAIPQAMAALLPQIVTNALVGRNRQVVDAGDFSVNQVYNGNQWKVTATQALFNYQAWAQIQQAKASVKASLATFNDAAQNLILRTTTAYTNHLLAVDTLRYAEAKKRANKRQLEQAQEQFNVGLTPITSVYEAQAAYDQSVAQVIAAKNNLVNQNENLRKLTNHTYEQIAALRRNQIPLIQPEPNVVEEWVSTGLKQNYALFAAKYSLQAARENIKNKASENWPTFNLQASTVQTHYQDNSHAEPSVSNLIGNIFIPTSQEVSNVSINMNFPVYTGGLVQANIRQAQFNFQTASEKLEQVYRNVSVSSHIAFNTIKDGISKVRADRKTIVSQTNSLESVEAQFQVGTRTMTDVVLAQERLFQAQQQLAGDQYNLINALLNLKYLAGTLNVNDLEEINAWLDTTRVNRLAPSLSKVT